MKNYLFSIIVPCYNQAEYLDEALQSVYHQNYPNWECIIVDDGSPDSTQEIAKKWLTKDKRFKYLHQKNQGVSTARNYGISYANGELILPLDADDRIAPNYLSLAIPPFQEYPKLKVLYCKAEKFGKESGIWKLNSFSLFQIALQNVIFCSAIFKKKDWERVGGYDPVMIQGYEDWEFWISLLKDNGAVHILDEVCFFYRIKDNSRTTKLNEEKKKKLLEHLSIKHADFFVEQLGSFHSLRKDLIKKEKEYQLKLKSEKFVLDLFFRTFFGIGVFKKFKR